MRTIPTANVIVCGMGWQGAGGSASRCRAEHVLDQHQPTWHHKTRAAAAAAAAAAAGCSLQLEERFAAFGLLACASASAAASGPWSRTKQRMSAACTPCRAGASTTARLRPVKNSFQGTPLRREGLEWQQHSACSGPLAAARAAGSGSSTWQQQGDLGMHALSSRTAHRATTASTAAFTAAAPTGKQRPSGPGKCSRCCAVLCCAVLRWLCCAVLAPQKSLPGRVSLGICWGQESRAGSTEWEGRGCSG